MARGQTSPDRPPPATGRSGRGPLGALPALSSATRRALAGSVLLAAANAVTLVACAWALSGALAVIVAGRPTGLTGRLLVLAVAVLARALIGWATQVVSARAAAGAKEELRGRLLDAAARRGPEWLTEYGPAQLTALATHGLDALDGYFTRYLPALVGALVATPLVGLAVLLADWRSAVVIALTVPLIPLFAVLIGRFTASRVARAADATARLAGHLLELVRALPVLTAFGRARAQAEAVRRVSERHRRATTSTLRVAFLSAAALDLIATLSVALVAVDIGLRLLGGQLSLATALLVLILAPECYLPLRAVGAAYHASEDGLEAVRRVVNVVGAEGSSVPEGVRPDDLRHQLDVTGLRVRRRDGYAPDGLTCTVRPGEITRLNSPSGAGKSTALAVLLGFVRPDAGEVRVGGTALAELDPVAWRRRVAWVPQRPSFAAEVVADELRLAVADSPDEPTDAELAEVAAEVAAEHLLGRAVAELSTGERQRIALARALLRGRRGAWLLLLDEPTAHVDQATAARLTLAIQRAADNGAAVLLATHRDLVSTAEPIEPATAEPVGTATTTTPGRVSLRGLLDRRGLAGVLLGAAALGSGVALTGTAAWLIARAAGHPSIVALTVAIIAVRAFGLAKGTLRYAERLVSHDAAFRLSGRLRVRLWQALVRLGPARTATLRRTDGLRRLVDDTDKVRDLLPRVLQPPLVAALVGTAAVVVESVLLPWAGVLLAMALLVAGIGAPLAALAAERHASTVLARGRRRVAGAVLVLLDAAPELIACGGYRSHRARLAALDAELAGQARRQAWGAGVATAIGTAALGFASLGSVWLAAVAVSAGRLDPVLAALLALVPLALAETVDAVTPVASQLTTLRGAYGRVVELDELPADPAGAVEASPSGDIALNSVAAGWPDAGRAALREVTLRVPAGTRVAVVGPSGAGKSTLLAVLLGFLPPSDGRAVLPAEVAWCPQEPQLVSTTVRENLRLGDPRAEDDTLRDALRAAALDDWVDRLDVLLGPGGASTSGGEATRLALARALLRARHTRLVLLDEPTAHLDEPTARRVLATIRERLAGHTVVHVTHRPDEAADADLVLAVAGGRVTEATTPVARTDTVRA